jgi:hypothetical protein
MEYLDTRRITMSDTVVLYVTRDGHSRALALELGARLKGGVYEIGDLVNRRGLLGWIRSGRQASMGRATPIRDPKAELGRSAAVVLVQPVWASAVCPPVRSWLRAHAKELAGKRVAVLASAYGTPAAVLRAKFESEFGLDIGKLAACAVVKRDDDEALRGRELDQFIAELSRG